MRRTLDNSNPLLSPTVKDNKIRKYEEDGVENYHDFAVKGNELICIKYSFASWKKTCSNIPGRKFFGTLDEARPPLLWLYYANKYQITNCIKHEFSLLLMYVYSITDLFDYLNFISDQV